VFRISDLVLLVVVFSSMLAGSFFPHVGRHFQPYPLYSMMFLLFLSFLSLELSTVGKTLRNHFALTVWLILFKLVALPVVVYFVLKAVSPHYATAGLLLSGVSTGVVAPFIATLVRSNGPFVLLMVVGTSLLVPITLPFLVHLFLGKNMDISIIAMMKTLGLIVFLPILAVEGCRKWVPALGTFLLRCRYPISLGIFAIIDLGVFSKYGVYFRQQPQILLNASFVALALGGMLFFLGIVSAWRAEPGDRIAAAIAAGNMNNVLIIVFSSRFFGPLEATVAAMYMVPFFLLIFPLRAYEYLYMKRSRTLLKSSSP
jgi:bile acid:Na+ symporter, BASS family